MKRYIFSFFLLLLSSCTLMAKDDASLKAQADSAFNKEKYENAIKLYTKIAKHKESAQICYNIGCAYYRLDNMAKSVLWFERAAYIDPGDEDIRFNLEMARSKTIDKITPLHESIIVSFYRSIVNMMNLHQWAISCITLFILCLLCVILFFFADSVLVKKAGFYSAILFFVLTVIGNISAFQQRSTYLNRSHGIIMSPSVTIKSTPADNGNDLFVLHEGTAIEIHDKSLKDWAEVSIADGKKGWIKKKDYEDV